MSGGFIQNAFDTKDTAADGVTWRYAESPGLWHLCCGMQLLNNRGRWGTVGRARGHTLLHCIPGVLSCLARMALPVDGHLPDACSILGIGEYEVELQLLIVLFVSTGVFALCLCLMSLPHVLCHRLHVSLMP